MATYPLLGLDDIAPTEFEMTSELIDAAYKRSLRFGLYWKLKPEERAVLFLSRRLKVIKSSTLREILVKIIEKVWPEKARSFQTISLGKRILLHKVRMALKIGANSVARSLLEADLALITQLGYEYIGMPVFYRPKIDYAIL